MSKNNRLLFDPPGEIQHLKKRAFLKLFANDPRCMGNIRRTCTAAKLHNTTYYEWLHNDPQFAAALRDAKEFAIETLENRLDRAALDEEDMNVTAAIFRLKGLRPEVYRERHEITMTRAEREARIAELLSRRPSPAASLANGESNGHAAE